MKLPFGSKDERNLCGKQMVRDNGSTVSFSLVGLWVVFGVGGLVVGGAMGMESFADGVRLGMWNRKQHQHGDGGRKSVDEHEDEDSEDADCVGRSGAGSTTGSRTRETRRRREPQGKDYKYVNWVADNIFQLQRMAYESADAAATATNTLIITHPALRSTAASAGAPDPAVEKWWTHTAANVPVTVTPGPKGHKGAKGVLFGGWRGVDRQHPSLIGRQALSADGGYNCTLADDDAESGAEGKKKAETVLSSRSRSRWPRQTWQEKEKEKWTTVEVTVVGDTRQQQNHQQRQPQLHHEPQVQRPQAKRSDHHIKFHLPRPPVALKDPGQDDWV